MKTIVITGGTGDLGRVVVPRLSKEYRCAVMYRHADSWNKLSSSAKGLIGIGPDDDVKSVAPVYGLVMLAGGFAMGSTPDVFDRMIETNLMSAVRAIDTTLPHLASPGRVIAISSAASLSKPPGLAAYGASKAALNAMIETLAKDLKDRSITVNALLPSALDTGTNERAVKRENVAEMISLLLSEQAANVSGQLIAMSA